jgi:hypothetical protein
LLSKAKYDCDPLVNSCVAETNKKNRPAAGLKQKMYEIGLTNQMWALEIVEKL